MASNTEMFSFDDFIMMHVGYAAVDNYFMARRRLYLSMDWVFKVSDNGLSPMFPFGQLNP